MNRQAFAFILIVIIGGFIALGVAVKLFAVEFAKQGNHQMKLGMDDASVKIVHFVDFTNSGSRRISNQLLQLKTLDPDIQIIMRLLPQKEAKSEALAKATIAAMDYNLYEGLYNRFMRMPINELEGTPVPLLLSQMRVDSSTILAQMEAPKVGWSIQWNRILAKAMNADSAPLLVVGNEVINHDANSLTDLKILVERQRKTF